MARDNEQCGDDFEPIPKTIHQTWKTEQVPGDWLAYQASWTSRHPLWQYRLWTDTDNRRLIEERYAWFLPTYDAFPRPIQRVDAAKYFILHAHGGVYADLDCECVKPLDDLIACGGAVVSRTRDGVIDCAVLASPPGHPFWALAFEQMRRPTRVTRVLQRAGYEASYVLFTTGTRMMKRAVRIYRRQAAAPATAGLTVYAARFLSSRSWLDRYEPFNEPEAYVRHHYTDSWLRPGEQRVHRWFTRRAARWAATVTLLAGSLLVATC